MENGIYKVGEWGVDLYLVSAKKLDKTLIKNKEISQCFDCGKNGIIYIERYKKSKNGVEDIFKVRILKNGDLKSIPFDVNKTEVGGVYVGTTYGIFGSGNIEKFKMSQEWF